MPVKPQVIRVEYVQYKAMTFEEIMGHVSVVFAERTKGLDVPNFVG